jgi:heme exporter protein D
MSFKQQATDQAVQHTSTFVGSKLATGMTYGGGATAFVGGLTLNEFAIVFGMVIGLLGLVLQVYQTVHKRRVYMAERKAIEERSRREEEEHRAKMEMYL